MNVLVIQCVSLTLCDPMDCNHQAHLSTKFSRQEYWNGLLFPTLGYLPKPGIELTSLESPSLAGRSFSRLPLGKL